MVLKIIFLFQRNPTACLNLQASITTIVTLSLCAFLIKVITKLSLYTRTKFLSVNFEDSKQFILATFLRYVAIITLFVYIFDANENHSNNDINKSKERTTNNWKKKKFPLNKLIPLPLFSFSFTQRLHLNHHC